jgi:hypothetical protein
MGFAVKLTTDRILSTKVMCNQQHGRFGSRVCVVSSWADKVDKFATFRLTGVLLQSPGIVERDQWLCFVQL